MQFDRMLRYHVKHILFTICILIEHGSAIRSGKTGFLLIKLRYFPTKNFFQLLTYLGFFIDKNKN